MEMMECGDCGVCGDYGVGGDCGYMKSRETVEFVGMVECRNCGDYGIWRF